MTSALFLWYLAFIVAVVVALAVRYLPRVTMLRVLAILPVWLVYVGLLSYFGVISNPTLRPPGPLLIFVPFLLFVFVLAVSSAGGRIALAFPVWVVLAMQSFRVGVELLLHRLWMDGLVPRMMTYAGANVDILIGLSAPVIAWVSTRGRSGQKLALAWNVLGLLTLTNVVVRAVLTAPGPLNFVHADFPNRALGIFPFTFLAGFFVPLAVVLHILSIRALRSKLRGDRPLTAGAAA